MNPDPDEQAHPGQEDLHWGEGIKEKQRGENKHLAKGSKRFTQAAGRMCLMSAALYAPHGVEKVAECSSLPDKKPSSKYWALSEQARKIIPGESQCRMFCGGKACKYCTPDNWKPEQMVIDGLYSEWVTDNIIAMARMSTENIEKFKMIRQLKNGYAGPQYQILLSPRFAGQLLMGIKTIINLQQPGEHAYCGNGINSSGFSYDPQQFMEAGFFFYNFALGDYGIASMEKLLDIVKVTQFAMSQGKVAIHCHAGLGRTGLIIACYLIYNNRVEASKSVQYVRSRRTGAIQTKEQLNTCHEFEQYLKLFFIIFPCRIPDMHSFSFSHFLSRQRNLLHGYEGRKLKHLPKIIYVCCERLLELCGKGRSLSSLRQIREDELTKKLLEIDSDHSTTFTSDPRQDDGIFQSSTSKVIHGTNNGRMGYEENLPAESPSSKWRRNEIDSHSFPGRDDTTNSFRNRRNLSSRERLPNDHQEMAETSGNETENYSDESSDESEDRLLSLKYAKTEGQGQFEGHKDKASTVLCESQAVCSAILVTEYSPEESADIKRIEENLNKSEESWGHLARETNPCIVCGVMWDWLDELCEPILRAQDVYTLIENSSDLHSALSRLEKSTKYFLEYISRVLSKLEPLPVLSLHSAVMRFLCHLTQKRHGNIDIPSYSSLFHMMEEKPDVSQHIFDLFMRMIEREKGRD